MSRRFGDESLRDLVPTILYPEGPVARQFELRELVGVALSALTSEQRRAFVWSTLHGYTAADIAAFLKVSESRARGIVSEAKAAGRAAVQAVLGPGEKLSI